MRAAEGLRAWHSGQFSRVGHKRNRAQTRDMAVLLGHEPYLLADQATVTVDSGPEDLGGAGLGFHETEEGLDQRGLSGAVRPQKPRAALGDLAGEFIESREGAVLHGQLVDSGNGWQATTLLACRILGWDLWSSVKDRLI